MNGNLGRDLKGKTPELSIDVDIVDVGNDHGNDEGEVGVCHHTQEEEKD